MTTTSSIGALFSRLRGGAGKRAASEIDPICGMSVDPAKAAGSHVYRGKAYFFCSTHCLDMFTTDPAKHIDKEKGMEPPVARA